MSTADLIASMRELESGQISDALEEAGLGARVLTGFTRLGTKAGPMIGPAVTVQQRLKTSDEPRTQRMVRHREVSDGIAGPGDVVVIATGGHLGASTWGENHAMRCVVRAVEGCLTDGAVRDAETLNLARASVFCRGFSPVKSMWTMVTESINQPVVIDGVTIRPGDIIFADRTGTIVIPAEHLAHVACMAHKIRKRELENQTRLLPDRAP